MGGNVRASTQLLKHIKLIPNSVYHPTLIKMLNLSARFKPHILLAITDDPIDNIIRTQPLPSVILQDISLKEKLRIISSARQFAADFDLNVIPGFIDELTSTIFPSYVIDGTYRAHLEKLEMRKEWVDSIASGKWNSKQYLHYLLNMYATGVCGVLPSQQTKDSAISEQLTYECATFLIQVFLLEVINSSQAKLQEWAANLRDQLVVDTGKIFVDNLYRMLGDLQIFNLNACKQSINTFINHVLTNHYNKIGTYSPCTCDSSILKFSISSVNECKRRWNEMVLEQPVSCSLSPHSMRQFLDWILQLRPLFKEFSPKLWSHGVLLVLDTGVSTNRVPRIHVKITGNVSRSKLSALDRIFPPTSTVDSKHMVTRLSAIISAMFKDNWRQLVTQGGGVPVLKTKSSVAKFIHTELLDHYPGTPQNIIICKLLAGFGDTPGVQRFVQILRANDVWSLSPNAMVKVLKQSSTMLRRHKVLPNLAPVSYSTTNLAE